MDLAYLRPRRSKPDPLPLDYGDMTPMAASTSVSSRFGGLAPPTSLQFDDSTTSDGGMADALASHQQIISRIAETEAIDLSRLTDRQMQQHKEQFDAEALKKACSAVNVTDDQYRNLIPIDFNAEALLKQTDDARLRAREKVMKSVLKK
uniref:Uncharacterized protein n=1 Tax=Plectus sambesii TaxID=2011161 RepID=A0A914X2W0_9BILA